ncbi:Type II CAAX prenyl endopeptidase Rce1-like [Dillenia turbinata]|uniref:Type II CAAX prenyl endopeptidase Rce1-like n=1 Tax=Dillenia turbinata TaxID=194707 RepID=A0AAN8ZJU9_9MAGN
MSSSTPSCCYLLFFRRPSSKLFSPSISRVRVLRVLPRTCFSISRTTRNFEPLSRPSKLRWRFSCFRHEEEEKESCSEVSEAEFLEDRLRQEELEQEQSSDVKTDWLSRIRKATDAVFCAKPWTVPWTANTILQVGSLALQVMLLWIASFWFVGSWIIPFLAHTAGFRKEALTYRGQAMYSLLTDVAEGLAGIGILYHCLASFRPLPSDWFRFSLEGNWQLDVCLGCLMFPLVNRLSQVNLNLLPVLPSTPVTVSSVEQSIVARDPVAMALYAIVVSVCAPVWEEIVFRGFLLPSLTKYMPVWCSILVSSVAFALAHFNVQRMLPLVFLGVVMGAVFARSRNLLASMLLHSLWNGFVYLDLMK